MILTGELMADVLTAIEETQDVITDFPVVLMKAIEEGKAASCFSPNDTGVLAELVRSDQSGLTHLDNKTLAELHTLLQCYQPGYKERVISPQQRYEIIRECEALSLYKRTFAPVVIAAIEEGKIYGAQFVLDSNCGCIYGHMAALDQEVAQDMVYEIRHELGTDDFTHIERLVLDIEPGQTDENTAKLAELCEILRDYE